MNTGEHQSFTAYIGIDWADRKHDVCIQPAKADSREFDQVSHQPDTIGQCTRRA